MSDRPTLKVTAGAELPDAELWWMYRRQLVDFSNALSWELKVVRRPGETPAVLTKTGGIYGSAGNGLPSYGEPNVRIVWAATELDLTPGRYLGQLTARFALSKDRRMQFDLVVEPAA